MQVGGGPTGVELAAEIHDLINEDLTCYFPKLKVQLFADQISSQQSSVE